MSQKPSKRQRFKNFILRRKLNVLGLLVITVMSALITLVCAIRGFVYTDILFIVSLLLVALCFVQSINLGGAAGDYYVAHALRSLPDETLCNDSGVAMRFYVKEENHP